ncbi:hypothetical protein P152DRAFT_500969, partial [Eremomyces bilateralis CBS 781.70]
QPYIARKRTLDGFFKSKGFKPNLEVSLEDVSNHATYPHPNPRVPPLLSEALSFSSASEGRVINDHPDISLVYYQPYINREASNELFNFHRNNLFFYRVIYNIKRGPVETTINTPRFTTVFGVDATSMFSSEGSLIDSVTKQPISADRYKCKPRPNPACLDKLQELTEGSTDETYNLCLVNYYASGSDSISYHSDNERFLGQNPAIASFSLGVARGFLMKHKPIAPGDAVATAVNANPLKFSLMSGDMLLMRSKTQSNWLHSVPKRKAESIGNGRINITFRKAMVRGGTENYYKYNVGSVLASRWDAERKEMVPLAVK